MPPAASGGSQREKRKGAMQSSEFGYWLVWPAVLAWAGLLFYFSSLPSFSPPLGFTFADKVSHAIAFGFLGLLLAYARLPQPMGSFCRAALVGVLVAAYGFSDEFHQSLVPGRDASAGDAMANAIGGFVAAFSAAWLQRQPWRSTR